MQKLPSFLSVMFNKLFVPDIGVCQNIRHSCTILPLKNSRAQANFFFFGGGKFLD